MEPTIPKGYSGLYHGITEPRHQVSNDRAFKTTLNSKHRYMHRYVLSQSNTHIHTCQHPRQTLLPLPFVHLRMTNTHIRNIYAFAYRRKHREV